MRKHSPRNSPVVALLLVALAGSAVFAPTAGAGDINLANPIVSRSGPEAVDNGYIGPMGTVGYWGQTSFDRYHCPASEGMSGYIVPPDDGGSHGRSYSVTNNASEGANVFPVWVTSWSGGELHYRVAATCTNNTRVFRYYDPESWAYGDWMPYWTKALFTAGGDPRSPTAAEYGGLLGRSLCWNVANTGCPQVFLGIAGHAAPARVRARRGGNRFALRNGTNRISLTFQHTAGNEHTAQSRRPPAVRLAGAPGCRVRRMSLVVHNGQGEVELVLRCARQKRGASARVRVTKPLRGSFRLRNGTRTVRVKLGKPPGKVESLVHVSYGRKHTPCKAVRNRERFTKRTAGLTMTVRCGRSAGNARAHLYFGGLLAAPR